MQSNTETATRIIACAVFKPAIDHLALAARYPGLRITYLPPNLHLRPVELRDRLLQEAASAQERNERVICLYGDCFPDIERFCDDQGLSKVPGHYCYEMLLGPERFQQLLDEMAETYFAERELITHFEEYCVRPLELEDEELRDYCFDHYKRLLYVHQPSDPDAVIPQAGRVAEFLSLHFDVSDADYSYLEKKLADLLRPDSGE